MKMFRPRWQIVARGNGVLPNVDDWRDVCRRKYWTRRGAELDASLMSMFSRYCRFDVERAPGKREGR